ncbi:MAG: nucleotidyltransferase family protein [Planctomycetes bacterium]|nr:nucleotidyltransferase family protein [Planctomycetota bacterium]
MATGIVTPTPGLWERYQMAMDKLTDRLNRITAALTKMSVPYALVGGQAVIFWVATKDPAAVRTTKDIDILLDRADLPRAKSAALSAGFEYVEVIDVGMFLEPSDPNPRHGVHLVWAGEKVKPEDPLPNPKIDERQELEPGKSVVLLPGLLRTKLMANRDKDRVHLRDMIDVGLIDRSMLAGLPAELATRLDALLTDAGR